MCPIEGYDAEPVEKDPPKSRESSKPSSSGSGEKKPGLLKRVFGSREYGPDETPAHQWED